MALQRNSGKGSVNYCSHLMLYTKMFNFMAQLMNKKLRSQQLDRKTEIPWIWCWLVDPLLWSVKVKVAQAFPTPFDPMDYTVHGNLPAWILEWITFSFSKGSSQPRSPALQIDFLPAKPQVKPKNTGVGSLSLLQQIFLTQESNRGLLHCRQILYQLSH